MALPNSGSRTEGFLARERPVLHEGTRKTLGHWGPKERQNILKKLAAKNKDFKITDYLLALDHTISRQQALLDLKQVPFLRKKGEGRGSFWQRK